MRIELTAFIVEAMGEFVADGSAGVAVIGSGVESGSKSGWLEHAGREVDVIHLRVVIGVHRGRAHIPLAAIDGLADFCQLAIEFEAPCTLEVAQIVPPNKLQFAVIAPFVGVSDLVAMPWSLANACSLVAGDIQGRLLMSCSIAA